MRKPRYTRSLMPRSLPLLLVVCFLEISCGYIGSPLPPLANVPSPVTLLAAVQRGDKIIVHFKLPTTTTETVAIKTPLKLDLRMAESTDAPFQPGEFVSKATVIPPGDVQGGMATYAIPTVQWNGKRVTIAARVAGTNGKESNWSVLEPLAIVPPPEKPGKPRLEPAPDGFHVSWDGAPGEFRVFRRGAEEKSFAAVATVEQANFTDKTAEYGTVYTYMVQRIVKLGVHQEAESELSDEATETLKDTFPPATPAGVRASPAAGSVELSWDRNSEADLAGYRIYRAVAGAPLERLAEVTQVPSYSDRTVESGKRYRYAVSAFDKAGNESQQSAAAEITAQ